MGFNMFHKHINIVNFMTFILKLEDTYYSETGYGYTDKHADKQADTEY